MYPQRRMVRQALRLWLPGSIGLILLALAYRLRPKPLIDAVRVWNKHVTNPPMMALAGRRYWYAAVIRHQGRRSGKECATPVKAVPVEGDFVVPLSYGESVDWLKNMLAAGHATIESRGTTYAVAEPEVIDAEAALPLLPPRKRLTWRLFGPRRCLKVKRISRSSAVEHR